MTVWLNSFCEEEPLGFHPPGQRGFSVRLGLATDERDQMLASIEIGNLLGRLMEIDSASCFKVFRVYGKKLVRVDPVDFKFDLSCEPFDETLSTEFINWLCRYGDSSKNPAFFTCAERDGAQRTATEALLDAHDVIASTASRLAPLPHKLHLAFVLRMEVPVALEDAVLAIVVCFPGEECEDEYSPDVLDAGAEAEFELLLGDTSRKCRTTLIKRPGASDPSSHVDPATGFCSGSDETYTLHAAISRFEQ